MKAAWSLGLLAFALALSAPRAENAPSDSTAPIPPETAMVPPPAAVAGDEEPAYPFRNNRVLFHPVTSFFINGVNGRYERRFADRRLGLGIPFYLGRMAVRNVASEFTWGSGLALTWFRTRRIQTARITLSADWVDVRRVDYDYFFDQRDPTFPSVAGEADIYHLYVYSASALVGYRWEYAAIPFTVDLDFGVTAMGSSNRFADVPAYGHSEAKLGYYSGGLYPVVQFSVGVPF